MPFFIENILSNIGDCLFATSCIHQSFEYFNLAISIPILIFAYLGLSFIFYIPFFALFFTQFELGSVFWNLFFLISAIIAIPLLRRLFLSNLIVIVIEKLGLLPKISQTEKIALTSGNTWVDAELFSGKPDFNFILSQKYSKLSEEEKLFLQNEVEEVCKMCIDDEVYKINDLPQNVWQYLKDKKFFGMIIPKKYGGLGFSALAHSAVIEKLSSRSVPLAITVMVPNSLGPAELLLHYGTKEQQDYYLPRLAIGEELPCFALTETGAGSDATSISSNGVLFKDEDGIVKIKLNFSKRYITLGGVATLIGVAFRLYDPQKLLSQNEDIGITCALIPNYTKGVVQGRRHDPLATPFVNSPINGNDVIIGLDAVIGGAINVGKGWKMLMECLAAGRGVSLPSTSSGGSKLAARAISSYCAIRQQFGTPIGKFEGVEEVLAQIASNTYIVDALRVFTSSAVDLGLKPAVITAIAKYHSTEIFRKTMNLSMDVMGGRAIIRGKRNILANAYFSVPISITVEGANIMTRSLIHFGQGAIMCHPFAYKEMEALENGDLKQFDKAFFSHIKHLIRNIFRSILLSISRGNFSFVKKKNCLVRKYLKKILWASATFSVLSDIAITRFGGNLKRKEKLNGRFGDILSALYLSVCVIKKFEENGCKKNEEALVEYSLKILLCQAQQAFDGIFQNLFSSKLSKIIFAPFALFSKINVLASMPSDKMQHKIVKDFIIDSDLRNSLSDGIFISNDKNDNLGRLENAFNLHFKTLYISDKIKNAIKNKDLPKKQISDLLDLALEKSIITLQEKNSLQEAFVVVLDAMEVDDYKI